MADNVLIKPAAGANVSAATDELADSSQSPKVTLLKGDGSVAAYRLDTDMAAQIALLTSIAGYVDGLEGYVDTLETLHASTNTKLDTLAGYLDGLEGYVDGIEALLAGYLTTKGYAFDVTQTPTVTNGAYSANDIVGALLTFSVARANDEKVIITGAQVICKAAVLPSYSLVLFSADPSSTTKTDNAAYSLNAADAFKVIAVIQFGTAWFDHGTPNSISADGLNITAAPVSGGQAIYGLLIDATGVTLTSTSDIQVRLRGVGA